MSVGVRRLLSVVLPLACSLALIAGCGGDEPEEPDDEPASEAPAEPGPDGPEVDEEVDRDDLSPTARRLLDACREIAERAPGVPEDVRRDVIAECEEAAGDDEEALRRAAGAACDVIAAVTVPAPLRGPAASACRRAIPSTERL